MALTNFIPRQTLVTADWLNSVDVLKETLGTETGSDLVGYDPNVIYEPGSIGYAIQQGIIAGNFVGTWNANTNSPLLTSGVGSADSYYIVSTAGTTTLDGISSWAVGDQVRFNGTVWQKVPYAGASAAENVTFTPTTEVTETNVQAALALVGKFTQGGTGAIDRTPQNKAREIVSVLDYAANGTSGVPVDRTGVTDSTAGIQAAINYASSVAFAQPASVFIPAGDYKITDTLIVPRNITIYGENNWLSRITLTGATDIPLIKIGDLNGEGHVTIHNLYLVYGGVATGDVANAPTDCGDIIQVIGAQTCVFDRLFLDGGWSQIAFYPGATPGVSGNHFLTNIFGYSYLYSALYCDDTIGVALRNFQFAALSATKGAGGAIRLLGQCEGINISGGECQRGVYGLVSTRKGVGTIRGFVPYFNRFSDVFFDSCSENPVFLDYAGNFDFNKCWIASAGYVADFGNLSAKTGILFRNAKHIRVSGGDIINNGAYGAEIEATSKYISFTGATTFQQNGGYGGGVTDLPAIYVHPNTTHVTVESCVFDPLNISDSNPSHQDRSVVIGAGTSNNIRISGNHVVSQPYTNAGTGTTFFASENIGQDSPNYRVAYTPTISSSAGAITPGTCIGNYTVRDGYCEVAFDCQMATNDTGSGAIRITLPSGFPVSNTVMGGLFSSSWRSSSTGTAGITYTEGGTLTYVTLVLTNNTYPGANATRFVGSIRYAI